MMTFSARRTTVSATATAVVVAVCLSVLSGCKSGSSGAGAPAPASSASAPASAAPVAGAFEPEQALAEAEKTPYAASLKGVTEAAGREMSTMTGRSNLGTVFTGRSEIRSTGLWMETVTTADAAYVRNRAQEGSGWAKAPRSPDNEANYAGYAKLLLAAGPSAKKGMENRGGVPTYHLAGHLDLDQVAAIDPRTHRSMKAKGVTGFDIDQWIDSQGRTVRFEQRMELRGLQAANKIDFSEFGPVETFAAPQG
ncbi:LppX_LprAFG lipoprotein [Streptomyces sp. A0592]|uniref:LppX_LprAFG lipoprotein n=1 Tax=Streptomyces sp. A0592 TaxID=2563099 RepID=UPI00109E61A5|nr:LppX_LprAFG lipoprotein [Streptomyces sp. A0592]THA81077.1 LppX_LprAFG lipoprotein [Streptomyces sp. A0592]